jgi:hypothetical protein
MLNLRTFSASNEEIAIAFRPDFFTSYVLGSSELHKTTAGILEAKAIERISREEAVDFDLDDIEPKERRQVLQVVNRKNRSRQRRLLRTQDQPAEISAPPAPHRERIDGRQGD